jgi:single-stranded DNA-binding protein
MSYIVRAGNLAGPVQLSTDDQGRPLAHATVIVNDRAKNPDNDQWETVATTPYRLTVRGRGAQRLTDFQQRSGNRAIVFAGDYKIRTYTAPDGTTRLSHDVWVDHLGADIASSDLQVLDPDQARTPIEPTPTPEPAPSPSEPERPTPTENPWLAHPVAQPGGGLTSSQSGAYPSTPATGTLDDGAEHYYSENPFE